MKVMATVLVTASALVMTASVFATTSFEAREEEPQELGGKDGGKAIELGGKDGGKAIETI